jgi:hypothetical protein
MAARTLAAMVAVAGIALIPGGAQTGQKTFATPQEAAQALVDAAAANDAAALLRIFGPGGKDIVDSGDAAEDKASRQQFAALARQKMQVETDEHHDRATIVVGPDDWPMPVPIVLDKGKWRFDPAVGRVEVLARRVGRNELTAIEVCRAYVEAQMEYASRDRTASGVLQYAPKILSAPGKKDGLYWEGEPDNLVPKAFADASAAMLAGKKATPYHGYYFRILKAQGPDAEGGAMDYVVNGKMIGGFALVAYPAEYRNSGVMTFIVNHDGVVFQKDLGAQTDQAAERMTSFNPDQSWTKVTDTEPLK